MVASYTVYFSALVALWSIARQYDCSAKTVTARPAAEPVDYDWR
jgi:hypothetical protein